MVTRELARELKEACKNTECKDCDFATGIYMEGPDYVYYFCELKKKPREYDIDKIRVKQTKESKLAEEKAAKKKEKQKQERERKKKEKALAETTEKPKKKRGRPKKEDIFNENE